MSKQAAGLYRAMLRTANAVFREDRDALNQARMRLRQEFSVPLASAEDGQERENVARDVIKILRTGIVQGVRQGDSNVYKLRIRPETQLGDNNDRFKTAKFTSPTSSDTSCCGGSASTA